MKRSRKEGPARKRSGKAAPPQGLASVSETASVIASHGSRALQEIGSLLDHTLGRIEDVFGPDHPHFAQALDNYAASLRRLADLAQGRAQQIRATLQQQSEPRRAFALRSTAVPIIAPTRSVAPQPDKPPSSKLLGVQEASSYLTISPDTLYGLVRSGEIPHSRVGRSIRFRTADLDRYVEDRTSQSWTRVDRRGRPPRR